MKKSKKILILFIAIFILLQTILPTISQAVTTITLNAQKERPYNDDDGDKKVGNDSYTMLLKNGTNQTIFKIGDYLENKFNFDKPYSYYCLRAGLGFGEGRLPLDAGKEYKFLTKLNDEEQVKTYFKDKLLYTSANTDKDLDDSYKAICWIADNMYLPKSEYAKDLKSNLLKNAGINNFKLTDDDIEVVQQMALWHFTNSDTKGREDSFSLADTINIANILKINEKQPDNNIENNPNIIYTKERANQINILYQYFITNAKKERTENPLNKDIIFEKMELDKTLKPEIKNIIIPNEELDAILVGPFKINEIKKIKDYNFSSTLEYKENEKDTEWQKLTIDNTMGLVCISDALGVNLERTQIIQDMIGGEEFFIRIISEPLDIMNIDEFKLSIQYDSSCYTTDAEVYIAEIEDQPVLKIKKIKHEEKNSDEILIKKNKEPQKEFDLALRKFIIKVNNQEIVDRIPQLKLETLKKGTFNRNGNLEYTATYIHPKDAIHLKREDTVLYKIRIYNEGAVDGFAKEVTDYLNDDLEFIPASESSINAKYGWILQDDGKTLKTNYLQDKVIKAYDENITRRNS